MLRQLLFAALGAVITHMHGLDSSHTSGQTGADRGAATDAGLAAAGTRDTRDEDRDAPRRARRRRATVGAPTPAPRKRGAAPALHRQRHRRAQARHVRPRSLSGGGAARGCHPEHCLSPLADAPLKPAGCARARARWQAAPRPPQARASLSRG
ncbi:MAG: hypothetical protein J3K34DRAFT_48164 [Monoraphidium minutum]|nr:MAG: hypothetical protein J3K34DRAFT_48164 [Monoraphidium minutum]